MTLEIKTFDGACRQSGGGQLKLLGVKLKTKTVRKCDKKLDF